MKKQEEQCNRKSKKGYIVIWTQEEDGTDITANSLHPETIATNLFRHMDVAYVNAIGRLMLKNVQQGATTTCYVALHPQVKGVSGKYLSDSNLSKITSHGTDANLVKKL
ncbi:hypothetical protein HN51_062053 [Arachis hypogaea]|uniref:Short-chain dehydrogenase TIC 32 n=1 Tax=Arachis hypogaea TaxID=3818 RepID=A0A445ARD6_ARAHY|nr:short-chain dehydrogenase TIC 32, chloroplastic-like [Arachis ipaensis]XP_020975329.1 short-chain dehydrogenase TIC 32, chloroplastic-like [Arachis ipaensis]XP_020975332.1 short-chain dehydrogenase TIC 32, chloroplastic-like [Arachis ipaensis]XP_020975335.1 short-chain dehydrogenase TIC 32, chloroplastic-like [Arachis ipaensis]XP_020975339.1 short-chain dehydrogenase TIC 32, chloroplastic-like [Arachis ipaensis]XP_025627370.1 short-chain dehydrogenase TIC 32, chloroplastic [Arachis hypogaea